MYNACPVLKLLTADARCGGTLGVHLGHAERAVVGSHRRAAHRRILSVECQRQRWQVTRRPGGGGALHCHAARPQRGHAHLEQGAPPEGYIWLVCALPSCVLLHQALRGLRRRLVVLTGQRRRARAACDGGGGAGPALHAAHNMAEGYGYGGGAGTLPGVQHPPRHVAARGCRRLHSARVVPGRAHRLSAVRPPQQSCPWNPSHHSPVNSGHFLCQWSVRYGSLHSMLMESRLAPGVVVVHLGWCTVHD
jgi:hypothetical protein